MIFSWMETTPSNYSKIRKDDMMIKFDNVKVFNFENSIRGMRHPLQSYDKSDSYYNENNEFILGANDLDLAVRLRKAGSDHRKYLRQIFVSVDITAPLYFFKEFDTYKVSTTSNSTSTMHTIHKKPFTIDDFSFDKCNSELALQTINTIIDNLNVLREQYLATNDKKYWYELIQLLPSSFEQTRMCTLNYETLINQYYARKSHKLDEWRIYCKEFISNLPYANDLIIID